MPQVHPPEIDALAALIDGTTVAVLTGAGLSTDSGLPDYRGAGSPPRNPMHIDEFMHDAAYRRRFWAGARIGALRMGAFVPNPGHLALARLEMAGSVRGIATQNVDGLHRAAGTRTLVELHGRGDSTRCTNCHRTRPRSDVLAQFDALNPGFTESHAHAAPAPDGDAVVSDLGDVVVPDCAVCGGVLRPDVVYFGERVPGPVFAAAAAIVEQAGVLLLAGTSLAVNTGMRLVHRAERTGLPIVVINRGPTAVDARPSLTQRIEGGVSEVLDALADRLA